MTTPDDARKLAAIVDCTPITKGDKYIAEALRDLARQVESLQADAERMNWIECQGDDFITGILHDCPAAGTHFVSGSWCTGEGKTFREAIDEARKQS